MQIDSKLPGLTYWRPQDGNPTWQHWSRWPHLVVTADQGGDGVSGCHALMYKEDMVIHMTAQWDPAHGAWRGTLGNSKSQGLTA